MGLFQDGWTALRGPIKKPYTIALSIDRKAEVEVMATSPEDALKEAKKAFGRTEEYTVQEEIREARLTDGEANDASRLPPAQEDKHLSNICDSLGTPEEPIKPADLDREQMNAISGALRKAYSDGYWARKPEPPPEAKT